MNRCVEGGSLDRASEQTIISGRGSWGGGQPRPSWWKRMKWKKSIRGERKEDLQSHFETLREENMKLKQTLEEKDDEIARLKISIESQMKSLKQPYTTVSRVQAGRAGGGGEEACVLREAVSSLRRCFPANDARQHTLDTLEQALDALLAHAQSSTIARRNYDDRESPGLYTPKHQGLETGTQFLPMDGDCTKVVYYMDKSVTPFRTVLRKRIGEATLRDFKLLFDRPGQYRYHFKTLDPEFGMVKEEVLQDDHLLPGWDNKIVAWIEEDCL